LPHDKTAVDIFNNIQFDFDLYGRKALFTSAFLFLKVLKTISEIIKCMLYF